MGLRKILHRKSPRLPYIEMGHESCGQSSEVQQSSGLQCLQPSLVKLSTEAQGDTYGAVCLRRNHCELFNPDLTRTGDSHLDSHSLPCSAQEQLQVSVAIATGQNKTIKLWGKDLDPTEQ